MKFSHFAVGLLSLLTPVSAAWSKEDREIFRIRDEISAHEKDPAATFYDILGIKPGASLDDINKAYRLKARSLHPDKVKQQLRADRKKATDEGKSAPKPPTSSEVNKAVKLASERQARLSLIANILRGSMRDRYDHFLSNGFPLWKGTDYYYNRYRPGLGTVITGLFLLIGGGVHYLILYMSWKRQKEFIGRYVKFARDTAWGPNMPIPGVDVEPASPSTPEAQEEEEGQMQAMNRKQRRQMEKETKKGDTKPSKKARKLPAVAKTSSRDASVAPTGIKKRVVAENGKVLVVDSEGNVFLEEQDEEGNSNEYLLDPNQLPLPSILDTAVFRAPAYLFNVSIGRFIPSKTTDEDYDDDAADEIDNTPSTDSVGGDFEFLDKSTESLAKAKTSGAQQGGKPNKRKGKKK